MSDKQRSYKRIAMISAVRLHEKTSLSLRAGILLDVLPTRALHPIRFVLCLICFHQALQSSVYSGTDPAAALALDLGCCNNEFASFF